MSGYLNTDRQTRNDLGVSGCEISGEYPLASLFPGTGTKKGKHLLGCWVNSPLGDVRDIRRRQEAVAYDHLPELPLDEEEFDFIEYYLDDREGLSFPNALLSAAKAFDRLFKDKARRYIVTRGVALTVSLVKRLWEMAGEIGEEAPALLREEARDIRSFIEGTELNAVLSRSTSKRWSCMETDRLDYLFRQTRQESIRRLLDFIYQLDAWRTAHRVAKERGFCCRPRMTEGDEFSLTGFVHPFVPGGQRNDWRLEPGNICIFTGSNMAGKSTTLKAISLAVWLAHCGLPVPARDMVCPVFDTFFTSINLPDSLRDGRSHFMAEVERIRESLQAAYAGRRGFIVLDEMFRGTNARDAYEASVAVNEHLKRLPGCRFLVSTHILEYARRFEGDRSCCFYYMESEIKDDCFYRPYRLLPGISEARFGYWLVERELKNLGEKSPG